MNPSIKSIQVREYIKTGVQAEGVSEEIINDSDEAFKVLSQGNKNRHIGTTDMNIESSRAHSVFTISLETKVFCIYPEFFNFLSKKGKAKRSQFNKILEVSYCGFSRI